MLLSGDDHVEVGSSLRSAAAFGLREVLLDDRGAGWFDGPHARRREARAAARRHKNPLHVRRALPGVTDGFGEIVVITPWGPGQPVSRKRLARGRRLVVVIGLAPEQIRAPPPARIQMATLGLRPAGRAPLRLIASITLAEIARQTGRPAGRGPAPAPRWPAYQREVKLAADGELLILDPAVLLDYKVIIFAELSDRHASSTIAQAATRQCHWHGRSLRLNSYPDQFTTLVNGVNRRFCPRTGSSAASTAYPHRNRAKGSEITITPCRSRYEFDD